MSKENETYRLELEQILARFNGKSVLTLKDVIEYTGRSANWCRDHIGVQTAGITAVKLALTLSRL